MSIGLRSVRLIAAILLAIAGTASVTVPARAWWSGGVWIGGGPVYPYYYRPPPPVVYPPPAYYAPPPVYYGYRPVWVPRHWNGWRWVPGHWA